MSKSHLNDLPELGYYILSLKHSPGYAGQALWWGPNDRGYVEDLNKAGLYTKAQIEEQPGYYNDGTDTLAILESVAMNESRSVRYAPHRNLDWWQERMGKDKT